MTRVMTDSIKDLETLKQNKMERIKFELFKVKGGYKASIVSGWFNTTVSTGKVAKSPAVAITSALKGFDFKIDN